MTREEAGRSVVARQIDHYLEARATMTNASTDSLRRAAIAGIVGATGTVIGGLVVQIVVQPATTVSDEMWSYPFSSAALVPVSILRAFLQVLVFIVVLGVARSGLAGTSRSAHIGLFLALAGTALLFVGELASIPIRDQRGDDTEAAIVGAIFGIGGLLCASGLIAAGIATARAGLWQSWRRFTPLATGISIGGVFALQPVGALDAGVAVYGFCLLALAVALYTQPSSSPATALSLRPQEQGT
jgi:hypothetical protein